MASQSSFPGTIDSFTFKTEILASDVPAIQRFQELKLKANRTPFEENELGNLTNQLRSKLMSADEWNKFSDALVNMEIFIRDEVVTTIQTNRDAALQAIDQKKNNVIEYIDGTTAGQLRNDIGVMGELSTTNKSSLVNAINEINSKAIGDASTTKKGVVQLNDTVTSTSITQASTANAVKTAYDRAVTAETNAKNYTDAKPWQKAKLTGDDGKCVLLTTGTNLNSVIRNGFYNGSGLINAPNGAVDWWYVEVLEHTSGDAYAIQKAYNFYAHSFYMRVMQGGTWGPWSQDLFTSVVNGKNAIAAAIIDKQVPASGSDPFAVLAAKISQISTGFKVARGTLAYDAKSVTNLPFTPKIVLIRALYRSSLSGYNAFAYGHMVAWKNDDGTIETGNYSEVSINSTVFTTINLTNVVFGPNYVNFNYPYPVSVDVKDYIVFGS